MKSFLLPALYFIFSMNISIAQTNAGYHLSKSFPIKSAGGYDYLTVDTASDKLYVSHGNQVNVLNKVTGDSIGVIASDKDVHGIALVHAAGKGYITNGGNNRIIVFDLKTNRILGTVPAGKFADGIFYDDYSKKVISCNGMSKNMTVVDPETDKVTATIQLTGWPEAATGDGAGKIYVNNAEKSEVDVIDANTFKIIHTWPISPGKGPSGLAIDRTGMRLFIGCENKLLVVMDATNGKIINSLPIGAECDAVGFDHTSGVVFSSNGEGTLTVIQESSPQKFTVLKNLKTQKGARTLAVDQITHAVYLPAGEFEKPDGKSFRPSIKAGTFKILVVSR